MAGVGRQALVLSVCAVALALGGCGGGGGTAARPAPIPAPLPSPPPPPPPPPPSPAGENYDDTEYRRSNGATANNALTAYQHGATGQGVKIAVIDSGINPYLSAFAGKIDPASRDMVENRGVTDTEGHGTAVSAVAAAARDGRDMMGVAFGSTILSLNTSNPNDCSADDGCTHDDRDIAEAIDVARTNGARVVNISLGGEGAGSALLDAVSRATRAGVVIVMSAGNNGQEATGDNPEGLASMAAQRGNGLVIIAGAHDGTRQIASFSNRAGTGAQHYLTALGSRVRSIDENGAATLWTGTSFSAPIISGAAALLASAFPNLSGAQIVQLLMSTADDAGASGRDSVFGNGILNIGRAFEPQGQTSMAGSSTPVSLDNNGQVSGPMGDASQQVAGAIILDGYSRAYALDLAATLARAPQDRPLAQGLHGNYRTSAVSAGAISVTLTMRQDFNGQPQVGFAQTGMTYEDSRKAKAVAGMALSRLTPDTAIALGFSESGRALQQRLAASGSGAFLVARDPMARAGFHADAGSAVGLRHDLGPVALTVTAESGEVHGSDLRRTLGRPGYGIQSITLDRTVGPATLSFGMSRLREEDTVLGGRFSSTFSGRGATSHFLDGTASFDLGQGWGANASYRRGWTSLPGSGAMVTRGWLDTEAFAADVSKVGAFARGDRLAFRVTQPLRVAQGGFDLDLPVRYDYSTGAVGHEQRFFNLAPNGREMVYEAAYSVGWLGGDLGLNAYLRTDPGHVEAMPTDIGGAIRFTLGF